jgi:hypothetical protein
MTGMTTSEQKNQTFDVFVEISDFLKWAQERVGPLTFIGLAISALLWLDFLKFFSLPVSFLSSSSLAALPALFVTVVFVVVALTINAVMPAFVLWMPLFSDGPSLASLGLQRRIPTAEGNEGPNSEPNDPAFSEADAKEIRVKLVNRWIALGTFVGALWMLWVASTFCPNSHVPGWLLLINLVLSLAVGLWLFLPLVKKVVAEQPSWSFILLLGGAILAQSVVTFWILYIFLKTTTDIAIWTLVFRAAVYILVIIGITLIQLLAAQRVAVGPYPDILKHVTLVAIGILIMIAATTPVGAMLVSYPLRTSAPDGGSCIVFTLLPVQTNSPETYATVQDLNNQVHNVPFAFVTHLEDKYYAKTDPLNGTVYPISDTLVGSIDACKKRSNVPVDASGKLASHAK